MHPCVHTVAGGAAGDDVELRALFRNDDVMHILDQALLGNVEAGLNRKSSLHPGQRPDKIAVFLVQLRPGGVHIRIYRHVLPVVVLKPGVFLQRLGDADHLQAVLADAGVDHRVVLLDVGAGPALTGDVYSGLEHVFLFFLGQYFKTGQIIVEFALIFVLAKVYLLAKRGLFIRRTFSPGTQFVRHLSPSSHHTLGAFAVAHLVNAAQ